MLRCYIRFSRTSFVWRKRAITSCTRTTKFWFVFRILFFIERRFFDLSLFDGDFIFVRKIYVQLLKLPAIQSSSHWANEVIAVVPRTLLKSNDSAARFLSADNALSKLIRLYSVLHNSKTSCYLRTKLLFAIAQKGRNQLIRSLLSTPSRFMKPLSNQ